MKPLAGILALASLALTWPTFSPGGTKVGFGAVVQARELGWKVVDLK